MWVESESDEYLASARLEAWTLISHARPDYAHNPQTLLYTMEAKAREMLVHSWCKVVGSKPGRKGIPAEIIKFGFSGETFTLGAARGSNGWVDCFGKVRRRRRAAPLHPPQPATLSRADAARPRPPSPATR